MSHGQDVKGRERRRADTFLNIIEDPGKLDEAKVKETRKLESRMMRKYPVRFGGGCDPFSRNLERSKGMGAEGSL